MSKKIDITFNFSCETIELTKQYGKYCELGQKINRGKLCKFIRLNIKKKMVIILCQENTDLLKLITLN